MGSAVNSIVIVGGGSAGWITAGTIAAKHHERIRAGELTITLCESPTVATIGVGEGTWPTMPQTLQRMGIAENDFIAACDVSFKQGSKFINWRNGASQDTYYHPFASPQGMDQGHLADYWINSTQDTPFAEQFHPQPKICEHHLAPKLLNTPEYQSPLNYAYHLDAKKFSTFLKTHCTTRLGVKHIEADITQVNLDPCNNIVSVSTQQAGDIPGDFFVDCTGFKALLIGEALQVPFEDVSDVLLTNTALAIQLPYDHTDSAIASCTLSTAQEAGWIWDIGLPHRRGVGHVFSKDYMTTDKACDLLLQYAKQTSHAKMTQADIREIPFQSGHRKTFWKNNCLAIGLSAGFLEPLEASALVMIELSARTLADQLPRTNDTLHASATRFNSIFNQHWARVIEFIKLHYLLNERTGEAFWNANRDPQTVPQPLLDSLSIWRHRPPSPLDFPLANELFHAINYQYILYGAGHGFAAGLPQSNNMRQYIEQTITASNNAQASMLKQLPTNRSLINAINTGTINKAR